ncbi:MAG TPA: hypothetical protein DCE56_04520 [Cyanobacteria bacterium UBA8553]|nr:hypothetical protein [Cyanobacteria bacterium UBA8553]
MVFSNDGVVAIAQSALNVERADALTDGGSKVDPSASLRVNLRKSYLTEILHHSQVRPTVLLELKFKAYSISPLKWTKFLPPSSKDDFRY